MNKSEIEEINEIQDHIFIKLRSESSLIISKSKTHNIDEIRNEIKSMTETMGLKHNVESIWKWR